VVRGGAFNNHRDNARCAYRNFNHPDNRNNNLGFRVVLREAHVLRCFFWPVRPWHRRRTAPPGPPRSGNADPLAACGRAEAKEEEQRQAQVLPVECGIPWLGFVVHPTHRLLKRRKVVNFTRRLATLTADYRAGQISFAELDASVQGWINHVRFADTWGLREFVFGCHPIRPGGD
jgi:hypothetical protein